MAEAERSL